MSSTGDSLDGLRDLAWPSNRELAIRDQRNCRQRLIVTPLDLSSTRSCLAIGVSYDRVNKTAVCAGIPCHLDATPLSEDYFLAESPVLFPYVPGLYVYRQGPAVIKLIHSLGWTPDLLIFDAQGVAHQRGFGLAAHIGVLLDKPSLGITRKRLFGSSAGCKQEDRAFAELLTPEGNPIGYEYRPNKHGPTLFASPGHRSDCESLLQWLGNVRSFRAGLPLSLELAHSAANRHALRQNPQ